MSKKNEFAKLWLETGGFITQKIAAEILEIEPPSVNRLVKSGKLKAYKNQMPFVRSVLEYQPKPQMKRIKNTDKKIITKKS